MSSLNEEEQKLLDSFKLHEFETRDDKQQDEHEPQQDEEQNLYQSQHQNDHNHNNDRDFNDSRAQTRDDRIASQGRLDPLEGTFGRPTKQIEYEGHDD